MNEIEQLRYDDFYRLDKDILVRKVMELEDIFTANENRKKVSAKRLNRQEKISPVKFMAYWNGCPPLPMIQTMSADRRQHLAQRSSEDFFFQHYQEGIERVAKSFFCLGKNDRGWKATVDWFLRPGTIAKVMEGVYDNRKPVPRHNNNAVVHTTPMVDDAKSWKKSQLVENDGLPPF
jgi:hypothetical protein